MVRCPSSKALESDAGPQEAAPLVSCAQRGRCEAAVASLAGALLVPYEEPAVSVNSGSFWGW